MGADDTAWAEFGRRLKEARRAAGLTQIQLARLIGYDRTVLSKVESGTRKASPWLAARLDEVMASGTKLSDHRSALTATRPSPLGTSLLAAMGNGDLLSLPLELAGWPRQLDPYAITGCVLHSGNACVIPPAAVSRTLIRAVVAGEIAASVVNIDAVHALVALLSTPLLGYDGPWLADVVTTIEPVTQGVARWAYAVGGTEAKPLWRLAAMYAERTAAAYADEHRPVLATSWFTEGLRWADYADDVEARFWHLESMSLLAMIVGDIASARHYADTLLVVDGHWLEPFARIFHARTLAINGDVDGALAGIAAARRGIAGLTGREAPWLTGSSGRLQFDLAESGAIYDLAVGSGRRDLAVRAVQATQGVIDQFEHRFEPSRLGMVLSLRLAASLLSAGEPEAATAAADGAVQQALAGRWITVAFQLAKFRTALRDWEGQRDVQLALEKWRDQADPS